MLDKPPTGVELVRSRLKPSLLAGAVALILVALLVFTPGSISEKYLLICSGSCAQRPAHTYYLGNQKLPVEARMVGIFCGFLLTWIFLWFIGRTRAGKLSKRGINLLLALLVLAMLLDGLNATFYDFGWFHPYQPQNWFRLLTGTLSGIGLAGLIYPLYNYAIWRFPWKIAPFQKWAELGVLLLVGATLMVLVMSGWDWLFLPLATLTVLGGLWMMCVFNLLIYVVLARRENLYRDSWDLLPTLVAVFLFSLLEFTVTAAVRHLFLGAALYM
ncbi:DUF2085 domain-containing protein [Candidatus Chlorohelix sp.]|uniref:DUF2085 domain-containing protein n=1 Tax=Candidatus Chlorohelix sp. TaxID=3139201 RepID=UPI0030756168